MSEEIITTPLTPEQTTVEEQQALHENFLKRDLVALDETINVLTDGVPDETISSRLARDAEHHDVVGKIGSDILDHFQHNHGVDAQAGDLARAEQVVAIEESTRMLEEEKKG